MTYKALPIRELFAQFKFSAVGFVELKATDGYVSTQPISRLIDNKTAQAFLAIEDSHHKWPKLPGKKISAGPFFLIWVESKDSDVQIMEWPYAVVSLRFFDDMKSNYPRIYPHKDFSLNHPVTEGLKVFLRNCFVCHSINQEGAAQLGPDLNLPYNPTEYLKEEFLKKLIRNPQNLRHWKNAKMSSFSEDIISPEELNNLISYLKHMSEKKYPVKE